MVIEAFAKGTPVLASDIGPGGDLVVEGVTGLHFAPGDPASLQEKAKWLWEHPAELAEMGRNARREYEDKYTAETNYEMLMEIYQQAIQARRKAG